MLSPIRDRRGGDAVTFAAGAAARMHVLVNLPDGDARPTPPSLSCSRAELSCLLLPVSLLSLSRRRPDQIREGSLFRLLLASQPLLRVVAAWVARRRNAKSADFCTFLRSATADQGMPHARPVPLSPSVFYCNPVTVTSVVPTIPRCAVLWFGFSYRSAVPVLLYLIHNSSRSTTPNVIRSFINSCCFFCDNCLVRRDRIVMLASDVCQPII
jgi:hypothetical protein